MLSEHLVLPEQQGGQGGNYVQQDVAHAAEQETAGSIDRLLHIVASESEVERLQDVGVFLGVDFYDVDD